MPQAIADRDEQLAEQAATIKSLHQQLTRTAKLTPLAASLAADVAAHRGSDSNGFSPVSDRPIGTSKEREQRLASEVQALQARISPPRRPAADLSAPAPPPAAAPPPSAASTLAAPPEAAPVVAGSKKATDRSPVRSDEPPRALDAPAPLEGATRGHARSSGRVRGEHASEALAGPRKPPVDEAARREEDEEEEDDNDDDDVDDDDEAADAAEESGAGELRIEGKLDPSGVLRVSGGAAATATAVRWWRIDSEQGAEWEVESEEGEPLSYRCSAEDVGCVLRAECGGQVATTAGVVRPPKHHLQVLQSKYKEGSHDFKVREAEAAGGGAGGGGKQLLLQMQADKLQLKSGSKTVDKAPYAGGVAVRFEPGSELNFELQLGSRRAPLRLEASNRQQRDMLLLALCSFSTRGWLEAALAGTPSPVVRLGTPRAGGPEPSDDAAAQAVAEKPKKNSILMRGAAAVLGKGRRSTGGKE